MEAEAKKMKCYKRLMYKQFVQVSGLCDVVSELFAETFHTPLQIELYMYGDAIFVYSFGTQIYGHQKSTKTSGVHFFYISLIFLFTWELALAYVHINTSSNTLNG